MTDTHASQAALSDLTTALEAALAALRDGETAQQAACVVKIAQAIVDWHGGDAPETPALAGEVKQRGDVLDANASRLLAEPLQQGLSAVLDSLSRSPDVSQQMTELFLAAQQAKAPLANLTATQKTAALKGMAQALRTQQPEILAANAQDQQAAQSQGVSAAVLDRLTLNESRLTQMTDALLEIAQQDDPVNRVLAAWDNPKNGLRFEKVSVPLGVIGMIYEARPNVTTDAAAICLKSGNPVVLRPGSNCHATSVALARALQQGASAHGIPPGAIQIVPTTDRAAVGEMLKARGKIDLIIPRGGVSLTRRVFEEARVPTLLHLDGNCHTYVDKDADAQIAISVVLNAKMRRTGICGATESLIVHQACASTLLRDLVAVLHGNGCELVGCSRTCALFPQIIKPATAADFSTEFLGPKLSIQLVDSLDEAIALINENSSKHTESIITQNPAAQEKFLLKVHSAITMVNTSTQFADGGEFGFGAEIGISTGQTPPRGPVGANQLVSFKYNVYSDGAIRPGGDYLLDVPQVTA